MAQPKATANAKETKKNNKGLIAGIVAAVVVVIVAIVCIVLNAKPGIVGKYEMSATITDGVESTEMIAFMKALGGTQTIEFKKDGTGEIVSGAGESSNTQTFTYTAKEVKVKSEAGEEITYKLEYKNDAVILTIENESIKYTRIKE